MEKIGIFGGTFNPPHLGHIKAVKDVQAALGLDRILIVPAAEPPHKEIPAGSPAPEIRLEMVKAAAQDIPGAEVSDLELKRPGKSYSADTLTRLKEEMPDAELYFVMGTDMFLSLHTWYRPEVICEKAVIAAMTRKEKDDPEEILRQKLRLEREYGAKVVLVDNSPMEISSTMVRRMLILGGAEKYVAPRVLEIIEQNGLYGVAEDYKNLSEERLREVGTALLKKKRVNHVLGCAQTAVELAERYGADPKVALRAGLLHDVTKAIDGEDQLLLVEKYDIIISDFERRYPKVLHAKTGAAVAKYVFGECDEVCKAIYWHTTGKADMSLMEKIIYLADYIEPTRGFDGVEELREMVKVDLDRTLLKAFDMVLEELIRENKRLCEETPIARDFLWKQLNPTD